VTEKLHASFGRLHRRIIGRSRSREHKGCGLYTILDLADDLALPDDVTSVDIKSREHPDRRACELDDLLWLDHAVEIAPARDRDCLGLRHGGRGDEEKPQWPEQAQGHASDAPRSAKDLAN
jgi:hypothetical protein